MANGFKKLAGAKWVQRTSAVALVLVLLAVVVSIVLAFVAPANKTPTAQPQTSTEPTQESPSTTPGSEAPSAGGKCNVPAGDMSFEPKMPADLKWVADKGFTWPASATVGPTKTEGPAGSCYARSPLGAALFVTNFYNRMNAAESQDDGLQLFLNYLSSDEQKQALKDQYASAPTVSSEDLAATRDELLSRGAANAGFVVDFFDGEKATVATVLRTTSGPNAGYLRAMTLNLVWVDDDWKISSEPSAAPSSIASDQYVPWRKL